MEGQALPVLVFLAAERKTSDGQNVAAEFSPALDLVLTALEQMRERGGKLPRASRISLAELRRPVAPKATARTPLVDTAALLAPIQARVAVCVKCPHLAASRTQTVFGVGNPDAELMFVGEAPGADEDIQGFPFVGRAGQLLTKIIEAIQLKREDVYIANVIKCRPPGNRNPEPDEVSTCEPFLFRQIDVIQPKVIVALGKFGAQTLLRTLDPISKLRGRVFAFRGAKLVPTFHPAYLLRNPSSKREVWEDMKLVRSLLQSE